MISLLLKKLFGSRNDRLIHQYAQLARQINALELQYVGFSDEALCGQTHSFKERWARGESLEALLPEAFAVCREGSKRTLGMRHFDVQLIGAMALHDGKIAEMRTGEGKTLVATLTVYLNALSGAGVHVVTVNDYLASRDASWMGKLYQFLGLSVGVNLSQMLPHEKQRAYAADITYGTNNEFGFDYLRDNMVHVASERVQRPLNFAIIDEVDSILIDEARTPLIISGQADDQTTLYEQLDAVVPLLQRQATEEGEGDFWVDEKNNSVALSEIGHEKVEALLVERRLLPEGHSLYEPAHMALMHHLNAALKAYHLFHRDQHYVVQDQQIIIVDEFTGRLMAGRRWSDGLHQAVEAKEKVLIQKESQTLASITLQNYFRIYQKLAGMTGTADTEAFEFQQIYKLETVVVPTHRPIQRKDLLDQIFRTAEEKHRAIIADIEQCRVRGQPVLVGTTSIENSEALSIQLDNHTIAHHVLNAKKHSREAEIIAQAGQAGSVTIATNMAGRGTDIVLGGNIEKSLELIVNNEALSEEEKQAQTLQLKEEWRKRHDAVVQAGGLHIIGTERHESRRVDNQLRGRAGRQGDPGSSRFYLSLEDPLLRIFAGDRIARIMQWLKMPEGEPIEEKMVSRALEGAQRKVEARNFDTRKQLLEYDDVANDQRKVIYTQRNQLLEAEHVSDIVRAMIRDVVMDISEAYLPRQAVPEQWEPAALEALLFSDFDLSLPIQQWIVEDATLDAAQLHTRITETALQQLQQKSQIVGEAPLQQFEKSVVLQTLDLRWREHLSALDYLRQGIHLRGYAQKNPKQEYKREAFTLFSSMLDQIKGEVARVLLTVRIASAEEAQEAADRVEEAMQTPFYYSGRELEGAEAPGFAEALPTNAEKIGRNAPCPCGSGLKYKQCHGKLK